MKNNNIYVYVALSLLIIIIISNLVFTYNSRQLSLESRLKYEELILKVAKYEEDQKVYRKKLDSLQTLKLISDNDLYRQIQQREYALNNIKKQITAIDDKLHNKVNPSIISIEFMLDSL